ncbi:hypothetical protein DPM19_20750 [Actinomadura craniellae]|uniref:RNA polymerase sigma factor 70 region 4 type 2 domain-containing protein n=1 Tax=Actinomadura craniellae TaxID=2231787 RepID=A0A365H310_9ACTN|nr:hypothetical protein [Actinomadura craniellae]RAY13487.1 hypothetical protein DPM19_20750 [Actinomadura craniellae]
MRDPERLYDAHADRLYSYCWSLVGDDAAAAVAETFAVATRHPPRGDAVLWMYALARDVCVRRGALDRAFGRLRDPDPLLRAAAALRADHREVLLLAAGEWLDVPDIARVLHLAPDTVLQMLYLARTRLERTVLDMLMRGPVSPHHHDVISAFEKGRLPALLARRAPGRAPAWLRADTVAACTAAATLPHTAVDSPVGTATAPLITIGAPAARQGRKARRAGEVFGLAACVAAVAGLASIWPSGGTGSPGDAFGSLVPGGNDGVTETPGVTPTTAHSARPRLSPQNRTATTPRTGDAPPATGTAPAPPQPGSSPAPAEPRPAPPVTVVSPVPPPVAGPPTETPPPDPSQPPTESPEPTPSPPGEPTPTPEPTDPGDDGGIFPLLP